MKKCLFYEISKLKESSIEAVDNAFNFNEFSKYLHIKRPIEDKIIDIINNSSMQSTSKLILVCGGVGDGKSHLLSYLVGVMPEILSNFKIYNDATESFLPNKTSMDNLNDILGSFKDYNLSNCKPTKIILAINLGTLNNFVNSKYKNDFTILNRYVETFILSNTKDELFEDNFFEFVNFSEYHLFEIEDNKVSSNYISSIFDKILLSSKDNLFYNSYINNCYKCQFIGICPIKFNYELLLDIKYKNWIIELLIKISIKHKFILSSRILFNFIFDIISGGLDEVENLSIKSVEEFSNHSIINFIFSHPERSKLLKYISVEDPLNFYNDKIENFSEELRVSENKLDFLKNCFVDDLYIKMFTSLYEYDCIQIIFTRLYFVLNIKDNLYDEYITYLFYYNTRNKEKLLPLYRLLKKSIFKVFGFNDSERINIFYDKSNLNYNISKKINIQFSFDNLNELRYLEKFDLNIEIYFKIGNLEESIEVDYALFQLINKMIDGYVLSKKDRQEFIKFMSFINSLAEIPDNSNNIEIRKIANDSKTYSLSMNELGLFDFKKEV